MEGRIDVGVSIGHCDDYVDLSTLWMEKDQDGTKIEGGYTCNKERPKSRVPVQ